MRKTQRATVCILVDFWPLHRIFVGNGLDGFCWYDILLRQEYSVLCIQVHGMQFSEMNDGCLCVCMCLCVLYDAKAHGPRAH